MKRHKALLLLFAVISLLTAYVIWATRLPKTDASIIEFAADVDDDTREVVLDYFASHPVELETMTRERFIRRLMNPYDSEEVRIRVIVADFGLGTRAITILYPKSSQSVILAKDSEGPWREVEISGRE